MQFSGLQGVQNCLQAIRLALLHNNRGQGLKRTHHSGADAVLRVNSGQILRKCVLTRPNLQLPQGTTLLSQTYFILDELLIAGAVCDSNKSLVNKELQIHKDIFD